MELWLVVGGTLGALLRKIGEWAAMPDLATVKGTVIEAVVGGAMALLAFKSGVMPEKVRAVMDSPLSTVMAAGFLTYLPISFVRYIQDWLVPSVPRPGNTLAKSERRGLASWR